VKNRPAPGFIISNSLMLWGAIAISSIALWPIYRNTAMIVMVVTATLLGSLLAILGAYFRWPAPILMGGTAVGFLLFGVPVAVPSEALGGVLPSAQGLVDLIAELLSAGNSC